MFYEDGKLIAEKASDRNSVMISRVLDSKEIDMEWHRMIFHLNNHGNTSYEISVYAANSLQRRLGDTEESLEKILFDKDMDVSEKKKILKPYLQKNIQSTDDILLHEIKGRYLWFILETSLQMNQEIQIDKIQVYFPRQSWISYLPEIYRSEDKNQFFERFLAIYQTLYEDLNETIRQVPYLIDVDYADKEFLEWLAKWLDIAESYIWSEEQLRNLLRRGVELYKLRGTRQAVVEFVKLYTNGGETYVVENFQVKQYKNKKNEQLLERLYGNNPYKFQVIVQEKDVPTVREYQTLMKIIEEAKPAYMELELVVLKPYIFLDNHTYMGMNSVLGEYRNVSLDGVSMLSFSVLGEQNAVLQQSNF
jgi:phage tail-like protein